MGLESKELEILDRKTIVILGASSFVGSNLASFFSSEYRVIGTYFQNYIDIPNVLMVPCDVLNRDSVQMVIYTFRPDYTIYCVGLTDIIGCHKFERYADALNSAGVLNTVNFTERYRSKFIYISTSYVFSGDLGLRQEQDTPDPGTRYGKTKAQAEFFIQKSCLNYIIFRCCYLYGRSVSIKYSTWFEEMQRHAHLGETIPFDSTIKFGFLDIHCLGPVMKLCFEREVQNRLFQVSSRDVATFYDFGHLYSDVFKGAALQVRKESWDLPEIAQENSLEERGPKVYQLEVSNIEYFLNFSFPTVRESLELTLRCFGTGKEETSVKLDTNIINYI